MLVSTPMVEFDNNRHRRKRPLRDNLHREFQKAKPPTFDGEVKSRQEVDALLLGIIKCFQVHNYFVNMRARVAISNFNAWGSIWCLNFKHALIALWGKGFCIPQFSIRFMVFETLESFWKFIIAIVVNNKDELDNFLLWTLIEQFLCCWKMLDWLNHFFLFGACPFNSICERSCCFEQYPFLTLVFSAKCSMDHGRWDLLVSFLVLHGRLI